MLTPEEIADLRAKAQAATPGPWANGETVDDLFNADPIDWWLIYAGNDELGFPVKTICRATGYATEEEEKEAREHHRHTGKIKDPGQGGRNAAFIAAANPQAILQLLDMVERLKNDAMPRKVKDCEERAKGFDDCMTLIIESFKGRSEETCHSTELRGFFAALAHKIAKERDKSLEEYKAFLAEDS